jgi:hypothetical protein
MIALILYQPCGRFSPDGAVADRTVLRKQIPLASLNWVPIGGN